MASYFWRRRAKNENPISDFQLRVDSIYREMAIHWPSECDDYAFCKVCDQLCICQSRTHRGIEQTVKTNSSVREFYAPPSKTADSKVVSVTRAEVILCVSELIVEQNIPLAMLSL